MNPESELTDRPRALPELSARDTADLLKSVSDMIEYSRFHDDRVSNALSHLIRVLRKFGDQPITKMRLIPDYGARRRSAPPSKKSYADITLDEVRRLAKDDTTTRSDLAAIAQSRFGIPRSRLSRVRLDEAVSIILAAANHEDSLDAIAVNAEDAGARRRS